MLLLLLLLQRLPLVYVISVAVDVPVAYDDARLVTCCCSSLLSLLLLPMLTLLLSVLLFWLMHLFSTKNQGPLWRADCVSEHTR